MKITFVCPRPNSSGGIRVIARHAAALADRGHEVTVATLTLPAPSLRDRLRAWRRGAVPVEPEPPVFDGLPIRYLRLGHSYPVRDRDLPDADVVVATWWETAAGVMALSPAKGAKAYFMQDYGAHGMERERLLPSWRMPFTFLTLTTALEAGIREVNPAARVHVVGNGVDGDFFDGGPRPAPPDPPMIGAILSDLPEKGASVAIRALQILAAERPGLRGRLVSRRNDFRGIPSGIDLVQAPDDEGLRDIYASSTVWLFPSLMEGYGLPILEAMSCGTPVAGTRAGAAPDLIRPGVNGMLCDPGDAEGMAAAARAVLEAAPDDWAAMSRAAVATARAMDWDSVTDLFEAGLRDAAARRA